MQTTITWYGHSAFGITTPDCTILIDPFFTGNPAGLSWEGINPDVVLVTHDHGDHTGDAIKICQQTKALVGAVVGTAEKLVAQGLPEDQLLNGIGFNIGGTVPMKGNITVTMTEAFHSSDSGVPTGYIITLPNGKSIYHAGDTGIFANMAVWGELYSIDVALLPIGGTFTMDARQAAYAAKLLEAKSVIPMHWGTFPVLDQNVDAFVHELGKRAPQCRCIALAAGESTVLAS